MFLDQIMNAPTINYTSRGMSAASLRHEVISNNIANVNTPNFKRSGVIFEDLLAKELQIDENPRQLKLVRTHDMHLPVGLPGPVSPKIEREDTTTMRVDNNNVDIDREMAGLAKNQLYYSSLATSLGSYLSRMKNAITSGQS